LVDDWQVTKVVVILPRFMGTVITDNTQLTNNGNGYQAASTLEGDRGTAPQKRPGNAWTPK